MTRPGQRLTPAVRVLFAVTAAGMLAFLVTLFSSSLGVAGLVVPLGIAVVVAVSLVIPRGRPPGLRITRNLAHGFITLGIVGLVVSVLFLARAAAGTTVLDRTSLIVLAVTMACMTVLGIAARKEVSNH